MSETKLRLNWHSNSPWSSVGYGVQTRIFTKRIKALGYPISITSFYGLQGGIITYDGMTIYPVGRHPYGQDVIGASAKFDHANAIISHLDIWVQSAKQIPPGINWYSWFPIDCEPMPKIVYDVAKTCTKGIVFSKFGKAQAEAFGLDVYYVPCGVETDVFKPLDMTEARKKLGWPQDKFIVGMVAANKGNPPRKSFFEQIMAFKALHQQHPDTMLYMHTDDGTHQGGEYAVDLVKYCQVLGLKVGYMGNEPVKPETDVLFCDQYTNLIGLPDFYLVNVYNALDVLTLVSLGEGFGIPLVEAQACGCPVITGEWTSMGELCFSGWKIPKTEADPFWNTFFESFQWRVKVEAVIERMEAAYTMKGNQEYRDRARAGAVRYDADRIVKRFWAPVLKDMESHLIPEMVATI
jgi:glycosyltransferase involved in cell wall biosynthesis